MADFKFDSEQAISLYKEVYQNIRETDNISFKLLGLIPLFAGFGSGILTYFTPILLRMGN